MAVLCFHIFEPKDHQETNKRKVKKKSTKKKIQENWNINKNLVATPTAVINLAKITATKERKERKERDMYLKSYY